MVIGVWGVRDLVIHTQMIIETRGPGEIFHGILMKLERVELGETPTFKGWAEEEKVVEEPHFKK